MLRQGFSCLSPEPIELRRGWLFSAKTKQEVGLDKSRLHEDLAKLYRSA